MTRGEFYEAVFTYCVATASRMTSGPRPLAVDQQIGSTTLHPHVAGYAADVVYVSAPELAKRHALANKLGLRLVAEPDHDHLQPLDWPPG